MVFSLIAIDGNPAKVLILVGQVVGLGSWHRGLDTNASCCGDQGARGHVTIVSLAADSGL